MQHTLNILSNYSAKHCNATLTQNYRMSSKICITDATLINISSYMIFMKNCNSLQTQTNSIPLPAVSSTNHMHELLFKLGNINITN